MQRPADGVERLAEVKRLGEVVEGAVLDGADGGGQVAEGGDDDDGSVARQLAQPAERGQAVHARQTHVEEDGVGLALGGQLERLLGGGGRRRGMALGGQGALQRPADRLLVIDDQDVFHGTPRFRPRSREKIASILMLSVGRTGCNPSPLGVKRRRLRNDFTLSKTYHFGASGGRQPPDSASGRRCHAESGG